MKTIQTIKSPLFFEIIPRNNADSFFLQDKAILLRFKSLKQWFVFDDLTKNIL